jgi:hypothetical protein
VFVHAGRKFDLPRHLSMSFQFRHLAASTAFVVLLTLAAFSVAAAGSAPECEASGGQLVKVWPWCVCVEKPKP